MTKVKVSSNHSTSGGSGGLNGNIENHNPNTTAATSNMMDKSANSGANSIESTQGSSGAAKYLINQLHLRPVETTRSGIEAPKIISNSNHHGASHQSNSHSFSGHHHHPHHHHHHGQLQQRMGSGIGDKLRPLLDGTSSRFS